MATGSREAPPSYLHRGDVGVGHVSVDVLDLRQVLLRHLDELRPPDAADAHDSAHADANAAAAAAVLRQLGGALVLGGRVLIVVPVLLQQETQKRVQIKLFQYFRGCETCGTWAKPGPAGGPVWSSKCENMKLDKC